MAKTTTAKKLEDNANTFASDVKNYTHQIWLAGLGAYAKAGKEGADYFKKLVSEGEAVEKQGKELVSSQVEAANSRIESFKEKVQEKTGGRFNKVEEVFDERVASTLSRIGIPSKKDIDQLSAKLDDLSAALKSLQSK
ncbi:MAG TPA: poly(3-hydroxyalkanoate) granule-associated protein PhaI [Pseudomonas sabulinigri]|uniref:Poly(Hydroxyalkanoate) granule-associated protein n=1 Tax=marine sediment metagenome TaxID=412755 RepID=A0A0F9T098_9ZZZZ|nr:poly(3-hydroxyalkanoate) granule-associated protein PhaI [Halopseudomonas sabulinigri]HEC50972.1 poly(3-hydroxyalkanoate) granule-associated protein PhaI [Halopseudomonas sabulinigri]